MRTAKMKVAIQHWPYRQKISISRGVLETQTILHATARAGDMLVHGEGEQHESDEQESVRALVRGQQALSWLEQMPDRAALRARLPPDGLRNALDAMLWDLECKQRGLRAWELAGLDAMSAATRYPTMLTVTLDTADAMAAQARRWGRAPVLKVKLGDRSDGGLERDIERLHAVADAAPGSTLTIDPNEGWTPGGLQRFVAAVRRLPLALIEQPLPAGQEDLLPGLQLGVPVAADEACTSLASLARLVGRVQYLNLKLDKCGGLTEALLMCGEAQRLGLKLMVGCNCGTSLAMAPAFLVASFCDFVDLDGPLHMRNDRTPPVSYAAGYLHAPDAALWG
ncbi:dipeptide epimerase [Duganella levis]|uniref:Dipeptide epimerase n=1 Tax=Duganella levis TaxID=2692169 RepID=A0ABW9W427_9BURK|nr:dipeptide epimerase [Duganella levis]MYN28703.1 dipeptide epimerase [Duganella levis]